MNRRTKILLPVGVILLLAAVWMWCADFRFEIGSSRESSDEVLRYRGQVVKGGGRRQSKIKPVQTAVKPPAKPGAFDGWGDDPFSEEPSFDFDEEKAANLSDELKGILRDLNRAIGSFSPDRKAIFSAVQRLLAAIYAGKGGSIPRFAKLRAIEALKAVGGAGVAEMVGLMGDSDEIVVKNATSALMEQLIDFDVTEAQQLAIIQQLIKVEMPAENYESIAFTISSFKNANKVKAALAIYDSGTDGALSALADNTDFIFDEAEAESIQTREDIVQYGKDHPDSGTDFEIEQAK